MLLAPGATGIRSLCYIAVTMELDSKELLYESRVSAYPAPEQDGAARHNFLVPEQEASRSCLPCKLCRRLGRCVLQLPGHAQNCFSQYASMLLEIIQQALPTFAVALSHATRFLWLNEQLQLWQDACLMMLAETLANDELQTHPPGRSCGVSFALDVCLCLDCHGHRRCYLSPAA